MFFTFVAAVAVAVSLLELVSEVYEFLVVKAAAVASSIKDEDDDNDDNDRRW